MHNLYLFRNEELIEVREYTYIELKALERIAKQGDILLSFSIPGDKEWWTYRYSLDQEEMRFIKAKFDVPNKVQLQALLIN